MRQGYSRVATRKPRPEPQSPEQFARETLKVCLERLADSDAATLTVGTPRFVGTQLRTFTLMAADALNAGVMRLTVDLSACGYLDGRAQGELVRLANALRRVNGWLIVVTNADMRAVFEAQQIDHLFRVEVKEAR